MTILKNLGAYFLLLGFYSFIGCSSPSRKESMISPSRTENVRKGGLSHLQIQNKAQEAFIYCKKENLSTDFCILADMSIHSGLKRMVVWDFNKSAVWKTCLVGHGCGQNSWSRDDSRLNPSFSNLENSHCSSLGRYKLGARGHSDWGIHVKYLMHGLDSSNSNAFKRAIVFHSWELISDNEIYPQGSAEGWGCPTISNYHMKSIDSLIKSQKKPILFWIYKS